MAPKRKTPSYTALQSVQLDDHRSLLLVEMRESAHTLISGRFSVGTYDSRHEKRQLSGGGWHAGKRSYYNKIEDAERDFRERAGILRPKAKTDVP
jgi:hypothetical protein